MHTGGGGYWQKLVYTLCYFVFHLLTSAQEHARVSALQMQSKKSVCLHK